VRVEIDLGPMLVGLSSGGYRLRFFWDHPLGLREPAELYLGDEGVVIR
jgi:hypothetical protein